MGFNFFLIFFVHFVVVEDLNVVLPFTKLRIGNNNSEIDFKVVENISSIDILEDNPFLIRI